MSQFQILWNGTGNAFNLDRGNTSFSLSGAGDRTLLVDCGGSVTMRLLKMEILDTVTDVLITHLHSDHIGSLESLAFFAYYALGKHGDDNKLQLHVATDEFAHRLWENSLKGGMEPIVDYDLTVKNSTLETFFEVHVGKTVNVQGLPTVDFCPTVHIAGMENYGLMIDNRVYYSGDTIEKPSQKADTVFHDCEFRDPATPGVHITYDELLEAIPKNERAKYYLTHVGANADTQGALDAGFGGIVEPGQQFEFGESGPARVTFTRTESVQPLSRGRG